MDGRNHSLQIELIVVYGVVVGAERESFFTVSGEFHVCSVVVRFIELLSGLSQPKRGL